jgi:hypothetical protein
VIKEKAGKNAKTEAGAATKSNGAMAPGTRKN